MERLPLVAAMVVCCGACRCQPPVTMTTDEPVAVSPVALDFGAVWVGTSAALPVEVRNPTLVRKSLSLTTSAPFSVEDAPDALGGGESATVQVRFTPVDGATTAAVLVVMDGDRRVEVALHGEGRTPPDCGAAPPCRSQRFDFFAGVCVTAVEPDGASCTSTSACFAAAECRSGECVGTLTTCDDDNPCTLDGCGESGCVNLDGFAPCPASTNPCLVPACTRDAGCGFEPLPDGTACGARTCSSADVCINGACVNRPAPQTQSCVEIVVGEPAGCGLVDGVGNAARVSLHNSSSLTQGGIAVDAAGVLWLADGTTIRSVTPGGVVRTVAGSEVTGWADGAGSNARFAWTADLAVDSLGELVVADVSAVRKVTRQGVVRTLAGNPSQPPDHVDGVGAAARFLPLQGLTLAPGGVIYVAETRDLLSATAAVRRVSALGEVRTVWSTNDGGAVSDVAWGRGQLFATRFGRGLVRLEPDGGEVLLSTECQWAMQVAVLPDGFACSDQDSVLRLDLDGGLAQRTRFGTTFGSPRPAGLASDPDGGALFTVARTTGCGLWRIERDGGLASLAGSRVVTGDDPWGSLEALSSGHGRTHFASLNGGLFELTPAGPVNVSSFAARDLRWVAGSLQGLFNSSRYDLSLDPDGGVLLGSCGRRFDVNERGELACVASSNTLAYPLPDGGQDFVGVITGLADGPPGTGQLRGLYDLVRDGDGGFFLGDALRLRHVDETHTLSTVAGRVWSPPERPGLDGPAALATFSAIRGVARSPAGTLFVTEGTRVRQVENGVVSTVASLADPPWVIVWEDGGALLMVQTGAVIRVRP